MILICKDHIKLPKTDLQTVLYLLLTDGQVSCITAPYMHGYRTRISELKIKYDIKLESERTASINRFGNRFDYHVHKIHPDFKDKAIKLYIKLTENDKRL